jgi:hypothetical protein
MVRLLVVALLYQVGFFLFVFASRAGDGAGFRIPICTGSAIVWLDPRDLPGNESPRPVDAGDTAHLPLCPLCVPAGSAPPAAPVLPAAAPEFRRDFGQPRDIRAGSQPRETNSARGPPRFS